MANKYNLSPTEKLNYVEKGKVKGKNKYVFKQFLTSVFIVAILILLFFPLFKNQQKNKALQEEISKIQAEIAKHEKSNEELRELLSYLESEQSAVEKGRLNFGLQKAGEQVIVVKRKALVEDELNVSLGNDKNREVSNFQKWINYFFIN